MQYTKFFVFAQKIKDDSATIPYYCIPVINISLD